MVFVFSGALALSACVGRTPNPNADIQYYTLETTSPLLKDLSPLPVAIRVEKFDVSALYDTDRLIYRESAFKRNAYNYHRWRVNPGAMVTDILVRDMVVSELFDSIRISGSRFAADYVLEGTVEQFLELDQEENWQAALTLIVALIKEATPDRNAVPAFQRRYEAVETCRNENPKAVVEALSRAMAAVSEQIIRDIHRHVSAAIK